MKTEFVTPRFDGGRFSDQMLPLKVARDLVAYEDLVIALAKHLYLQDHPSRERVPKGFTKDLSLQVERIDAGSTKPVLSLVLGAGLLFGEMPADYFMAARDLVTECIADTSAGLPAGFPLNLLEKFNQIGSSLQDDEIMELPRRTGGVAVLNQSRRQELVLMGQKHYEIEHTLYGTVEEIDWTKKSFRLSTSTVGAIKVPLDELFIGEIEHYGGKERHQVTVTGIAQFDSRHVFQSVKKVESIEIQHNYKIAARLDELAKLADEWLEEGSISPKATIEGDFVSYLIDHFPESLPIPSIFPTPEGHILLEWDVDRSPSLEVRSDGTALFHLLDEEDGDGRETEISLNDKSDYEKLFNWLNIMV